MTALIVTAATPGGADFAPAFDAGATVRALDLGPGLEGDVRSDVARTVHVLTVRNTTGESRDFVPEPLLPEAPDPLLFLGGQATTHIQGGRLAARLQPGTFVQLGRRIDPRQEQV